MVKRKIKRNRRIMIVLHILWVVMLVVLTYLASRKLNSIKVLDYGDL